MIKDWNTALRYRLEPTDSEPWCSDCVHHDRDHQCWKWLHAVTGKPITCEWARGLEGPCGVLAVGFASGGYGVEVSTDRRDGACTSCASYVVDRSEQYIDGHHDGHLCIKFASSDGMLGLCHELRGADGKCGTQGRAWAPRTNAEPLTLDDYIATEAIA